MASCRRSRLRPIDQIHYKQHRFKRTSVATIYKQGPNKLQHSAVIRGEPARKSLLYKRKHKSGRRLSQAHTSSKGRPYVCICTCGMRVFENCMSMPGGRLMAKNWHSRSDCRGSCGDESLMLPRKCQAEGSWQQSCKASPSLGRLRRASGCRTG